MRRFGLIGYPLSHSFSSSYFASKFEREAITDIAYENYPLAHIEALKSLLEHHDDLYGLNVTIPYKEQVLPYLDTMDPIASEVGAVNTLVISRVKGNIRLKGYNTDVWGFEKSLDKKLQPQHNKALILGTGGASKAIEWVLRKKRIPYLLVSRNEGFNRICYENVTEGMAREYTLWINTTPLGMFPKISVAPPLPYAQAGKTHLLFDLIYNPAETLFLRYGREQGAVIQNGKEMLELQAEKAWDIWNDPQEVL
jgi:shikimate dehydrogenase